MDINYSFNKDQIIYALDKACFDYLQTEQPRKPLTHRSFFSVDNIIYSINYEVLGNVAYNPEVYNDSHKLLIYHKIDSFLSQMDLKRVTEVRYNYDNDNTFFIKITIDQLSNTEITIVTNKENIEHTLKKKMHKVIMDNPGISLAQITQVTRFFPKKEDREKLLEQMEIEGLIKSEIIKTTKRSKRIYHSVEK